MTAEELAAQCRRAAAIEGAVRNDDSLPASDPATRRLAAIALIKLMEGQYDGLVPYSALLEERGFGSAMVAIAAEVEAPKVIVNHAAGVLGAAEGEIAKQPKDVIGADDEQRTLLAYAALLRIAASPLPGECVSTGNSSPG